MVKCFYLDEGYPEKGFREYKALEIVLAGIGSNGIIVKDRYDIITKEDIEEFEMYDETEEWDSFKKYYIDNPDKMRLFCENMPCKILVLTNKVEIDENSVVDEIIKKASKK